MSMEALRAEYHRQLCERIIRMQKDGLTYYPNFADKCNKASRGIAQGIVDRINYQPDDRGLSGQTAGGLFESITRTFLQSAFEMLAHVRPGKWVYSMQIPISHFAQYAHLAQLERIVEDNSVLASALGTDYIIKPDIVIGRLPLTDEEINKKQPIVVDDAPLAVHTPLRQANVREDQPLLHASISCKWTLRSDRSQNARTEALNLIRNRKGHLPHVVAITAEPLPTRIASLALGTGDMDCVYHFALPEMQEAIMGLDNEDQLDMLRILLDGARIRDISDLPFDLAA